MPFFFCVFFFSPSKCAPTWEPGDITASFIIPHRLHGLLSHSPTVWKTQPNVSILRVDALSEGNASVIVRLNIAPRRSHSEESHHGGNNTGEQTRATSSPVKGGRSSIIPIYTWNMLAAVSKERIVAAVGFFFSFFKPKRPPTMSVMISFVCIVLLKSVSLWDLPPSWSALLQITTSFSTVAPPFLPLAANLLHSSTFYQISLCGESSLGPLKRKSRWCPVGGLVHINYPHFASEKAVNVYISNRLIAFFFSSCLHYVIWWMYYRTC